MARRILIAESIATNRLRLRVRLSAMRYVLTETETPQAALASALSDPPDLVLLGESLGDEALPQLVADLKSDPRTAGVPVLAWIEQGNRPARLAALSAGADDIAGKPIREVALQAQLRTQIRLHENHRELKRRTATAMAFGLAEAPAVFSAAGRIALVSSDIGVATGWRDALATAARHSFDAMTPDAALDAAGRDRPPEVFVLSHDIRRPGGIRGLLSDLRSEPGARHSAIVVIHPDGGAASLAAALDRGAAGVVTAPFDPEEIALRLEVLLGRKREADRLRRTVEDGLRLAATDPLTGLFNRRYAMNYLGNLRDETGGAARQFSVMVVDVDYFKAINDTYGHAAGDRVLAQLARTMRDTLREGNLLARIGGEEFLIALPGLGLDETHALAKRLCRTVAYRPFDIGQDRQVRATISVGIAVNLSESVDAMIDRADRALYRAKAKGRNTVEVCRRAA